MSNYILTKDGELMHYGVKGMKWGVRRYQNADGSLTDKGIKRYFDQQTGELTRKGKKRLRQVGADSNEGKHIRRVQMGVDVQKNWLNSYNKAADTFNSKINDINARLKKEFGDKANENHKEYRQAVGKEWMNIYSKQLISDFGRDPVTNGEDWVKGAPFMDTGFDEDDD